MEPLTALLLGVDESRPWAAWPVRPAQGMIELAHAARSTGLKTALGSFGLTPRPLPALGERSVRGDGAVRVEGVAKPIRDLPMHLERLLCQVRNA